MKLDLYPSGYQRQRKTSSVVTSGIEYPVSEPPCRPSLFSVQTARRNDGRHLCRVFRRRSDRILRTAEDLKGRRTASDQKPPSDLGLPKRSYCPRLCENV